MAKKKNGKRLIVLGGILLGAVSLSGCGNKHPTEKQKSR